MGHVLGLHNQHCERQLCILARAIQIRNHLLLARDVTFTMRDRLLSNREMVQFHLSVQDVCSAETIVLNS